ncbi:hypothetical protein AB0I84_10760 [Streptomyces spectabilis]|uniref:hypothetical protein n=1 Tax=Streptomyces spectabilis TaxID=68270 RepID=UPI00341074E0
MSKTALPVHTDAPVTSCEAALKAVLGASRLRPVVLEVLTESGPHTHDELIAAYHTHIVMNPSLSPRTLRCGMSISAPPTGLIARLTISETRS